jgi:hypothetical protein
MEKKLWFKAKRYGWGWTPVTWQGWVAVLVYVAILIRFGTILDAREHSVSDFLMNFVFYAGIPTLLLIWLCYEKGEKPHWSWGEDNTKHHE